MNKFFIPLLLVLAAGYVLWHFKSITPPVGEHVPAKVAPQVKLLPKVSTPVSKGVKTYVQAAKKAMKLPEEIIKDDNIHVITSTLVKADDHPHTITTLVNTETGETTTLDRREPRPWFVLKKSGALGLSHDIISSMRTLYVRQDLVQSKAVVLSAIASIRSDRDKVAALTLEYRW